jgi:hypothetical protein
VRLLDRTQAYTTDDLVREGLMIVLIGLICLLCVVTVRADDLNSGAFSVEVTAGATTTLSGADDTANVRATGWVEAEMPVGWSRPYARVGITSKSAELAVNFANVATISSAEVGLGMEHAFSQTADKTGRVGLFAEGGFASAIDAEKVADKVSRYVMGGISFTHLGGGQIRVGYGWDETAGPFGMGHLIGYGSLPLAPLKDMVILTGEFTINVSHSEPTSRDIFRLGVMLDLGKAVSTIAGSP